MEKEDGEASILIELKESTISVYHGTDRVLLYRKEAKKGDWDKLWRILRQR